MKTNTIKWKIFKYNLIIILMLIISSIIIFNYVLKIYFDKNTNSELNKKSTFAIDFLSKDKGLHEMLANQFQQKQDFKNYNKFSSNDLQNQDDIDRIHELRFRDDFNRKGPPSMLKTDMILLNSNKEIIFPDENSPLIIDNKNLYNNLLSNVKKINTTKNSKIFHFENNNTEYAAKIIPLNLSNTATWMVVYSDVESINYIQFVVNIILFSILIFSSIIISIFSSILSKKISSPFSSINKHIREISRRNFGGKIDVEVADELQDFVKNINTMSEKLEIYDKAQKTFLQNASHEFRTPLTSIQSYAEGIKYDVVDSKQASEIIIDESKRLTTLVEELLYLSRLDSIDEIYEYKQISFNTLINESIERLYLIAQNNNIQLNLIPLKKDIQIKADEQKLQRAISNIISNCIRYAKSCINIESKLEKDKILLSITDDGPGFDKKDIKNLFERFYKGKKGNFGLGLSISKSIIEKHSGTINANNNDKFGAQFEIIFPSNF